MATAEQDQESCVCVHFRCVKNALKGYVYCEEHMPLYIIPSEIEQAASILQKAHNLINGPRAASYGNAFDNWSRTAKIWSVILGIEVTPEQAALCMIGTKLAREVHKPAEDNLLDIAGYVGVHELIVNEREERAHKNGG